MPGTCPMKTLLVSVQENGLIRLDRPGHPLHGQILGVNRNIDYECLPTLCPPHDLPPSTVLWLAALVILGWAGNVSWFLLGFIAWVSALGAS